MINGKFQEIPIQAATQSIEPQPQQNLCSMECPCFFLFQRGAEGIISLQKRVRGQAILIDTDSHVIRTGPPERMIPARDEDLPAFRNQVIAGEIPVQERDITDRNPGHDIRQSRQPDISAIHSVFLGKIPAPGYQHMPEFFHDQIL